MCTFANSEDPDEMPHDVAFHQDLHYFLRHKQSSEKKKHTFYLKIITLYNNSLVLFSLI